MRRNNMILTGLGAAAAALAVNYLRTEKGKQFLTSASGKLKQLATKAGDFTKHSLPSKTSHEPRVS